jgi:hypothetical protein
MRPRRIDPVGSRFAACGRLAAVALFVFIALTSANIAVAESPPQISTNPVYTAPSFVSELQRLKHDLEGAAQSLDQLHTVRETIPKEWVVEDGGQRYVVPCRSFAARLLHAEEDSRSREQEIEQAQNYLDVLAAEAAALSGQAPPDDKQARSRLEAILARPEYHLNREKSWLEKFRERMNEMIASALDRLLGRVGRQKPLGYVLLWIGVCAAAILIAYWIFRNWFRTARATEMDLLSAAIPVRSWQEWIFAAREAADCGDYRAAIHCSYWAGIARLQDLGALSADRAKTPREYLGALSKSRVLQPETFTERKHALSLLTSRLEKIWYGYHIATEADFRDSLAQLETLGCHLP